MGDSHHLTNSGRISTDGGLFDRGTAGQISAAGVLVSGNDALVDNLRSGIIQSRSDASAAVELNVLQRNGFDNAAASSQLSNFGLIKGAVAVLGGLGQETVINHGRIIGDVILGDGDDTFVFGSDGSLVGKLVLGGGADLVRIETGAGAVHVADFAGGSDGDRLDVSAFFSSFGQLLGHSYQRGSSVVIELARDDTLILGQSQLSALSIGDFVFA